MSRKEKGLRGQDAGRLIVEQGTLFGYNNDITPTRDSQLAELDNEMEQADLAGDQERWVSAYLGWLGVFCQGAGDGS